MAPLYLHGEQDRQGWFERQPEHVEFPRAELQPELQHPLLPHLHHDSVPPLPLTRPGGPQVLRLLQVSHSRHPGKQQTGQR